MGLAERRAIKDIQDNHLPQWQSQINEAAGFTVPLEIDWDSLAIDDETHLYAECWPQVYVDPTVAALASVARDDLGKEALSAGLKKITVKHNADISSASPGLGFATFADGVLALEHAAHTNVSNIDERTVGITAILEKAL
jgi:hypothetical protein